MEFVQSSGKMAISSISEAWEGMQASHKVLTTVDRWSDSLKHCHDPFSLYGFFFFGSSNFDSDPGFRVAERSMEDLGTLGGADANAIFVNERGQISGESYTNSIPNPTTGIRLLTRTSGNEDIMTDLGTLGGVLSFVNAMNNRGRWLGVPDLAGDLLITRSSGIEGL